MTGESVPPLDSSSIIVFSCIIYQLYNAIFTLSEEKSSLPTCCVQAYRSRPSRLIVYGITEYGDSPSLYKAPHTRKQIVYFDGLLKQQRAIVPDNRDEPIDTFAWTAHRCEL
jgi:hypothetical protein